MAEQEKYRLLSKIEYPEDLRKLSIDELPEVCHELREDIIEEVSINPGHLASSLGVTEITVALHYVYNTPADRLVWDVGHQAYGHKILTGRKERFCTNRKLGGLMPFPSPLESEYDTFTCGHASNSISAALGMAVAERLKDNGEGAVGQESEAKRHVVAIIGDGAMSGGLAFEGLNNVSSSPNDLLIILNDNDMSIDRAVGGMEKYLLNLDTNETYNRLRFKASQWLHSKGYLNDKRKKGILRFNNALKAALAGQQNIFEGLNIRYFGPYDGHDVKELVRILRQIKDMRGPKLLHLHTIKGKGYKPAEKSATVWHAPGKFDPDTGERLSEDNGDMPPKYQDVFGETLLELAKRNPRIVGVTPAMPTGCSMNIMMKAMPERTFDVGIAEGHAVTFSAGLALNGMLPVFAVYSTFLQRSYDQLIHDASMQKAHLVLAIDRAGVVGEDGETHQGLFDVSMLNAVPNTTVYSPCYFDGLQNALTAALFEDEGLVAVRYPRGGEGEKPGDYTRENINYELYGDRDAKLLLITYGRLFSEAVAAREILKEQGIDLCILKLCRIKPIDERAVKLASSFKTIRFFEEGMRSGSVAERFRDLLDEANYGGTYKVTAVENTYVQHASVKSTLKTLGLDAESMAERIKKDIEVSA